MLFRSLLIGKGDAIMLSDAIANLSALFGEPLTSPPADRTVAEGEMLELAGLKLEVLEIPGHSPGHVVFVCRNAPIQVFGGDVLFRGGIGRYDFPGGNEGLLLDGIRRRLAGGDQNRGRLEPIGQEVDPLMCVDRLALQLGDDRKIGRASCRERV